MTRVFGLTLLTLASTVALWAAQGDPRPPKRNGGEPAKKADAKAEPAKKDPTAPSAPSGEKPDEIIKRLNQNLEKSEERLGAKDPGADTRKIQDKIIDDIDELIKQQQNNQNNCNCNNSSSSSSSSSKSSSSSSKSSSSSSKGGSQQQNQKQNQNKGGDDQKQNAKNQDKKDGGADPKKDQDKSGKKDGEKKDQSAKNDPKKDGDGKGKDGKGGSGGGTNKEELKKNSIADLQRDVWGHLSPKQRQEMDIYGKQRFLPKYEDLLRQYYRTISESDRRKDD